jgi:hypothetical protein
MAQPRSMTSTSRLFVALSSTIKAVRFRKSTVSGAPALSGTWPTPNAAVK